MANMTLFKHGSVHVKATDNIYAYYNCYMYVKGVGS